MISFWLTSTTRHVDSSNWGTVPMGGAEISAVNLGEQFLKLGIDVTYYMQLCTPFDKGKLHVRLHRDALKDKHDIFICVRPHPLIVAIQANKKILWSGDAYDQSSNEIFWDERTVCSVDAFVFKSEWQRDTILEKFFTIPKEKTNVIYNGVKEEYFNTLNETPQRNRFIHSSTWYRGLDNFIEIWPKIKEKIPEAEIHVFSKTSLYFDANPRDSGYYKIAQTLVQYPGFILREPIPQRLLIQEMAKSWMMLYPNSRFVESSCGAALQSVCAGTPVVTTKRAGLPETVRNEGVLISESGNWKDQFVEGAIKLWENEAERYEIGNRGKERLKESSWSQVVKKWSDFLKL